MAKCLDHPSLLASSILLSLVCHLCSLGTITKFDTVKSVPPSLLPFVIYGLLVLIYLSLSSDISTCKTVWEQLMACL